MTPRAAASWPRTPPRPTTAPAVPTASSGATASCGSTYGDAKSLSDEPRQWRDSRLDPDSRRPRPRDGFPGRHTLAGRYQPPGPFPARPVGGTDPRCDRRQRPGAARHDDPRRRLLAVRRHDSRGIRPRTRVTTGQIATKTPRRTWGTFAVLVSWCLGGDLRATGSGRSR